MTSRLLSLLVIGLLLSGPAIAQSDDAELNRKLAARLDQFARKAFDKGFPRQAKLIWLQVLKLYDPDHAAAHKALGNVKVGASWNPDPGFRYPTGDTGTGADGAALFKAYETLRKDLAAAHREGAEKWAAAGRTDRAHWHWRMVLRWVDDDKKAQAALEHREIGTLSGTALEQTLYERSKTIEKAVNEQTQATYAVERVAGAQCAPLDRAQVEYVTVKSEHFVLHGDKDQEAQMVEALRWAERTLRVCRIAFPWQLDVEAWPSEWGFFVAKETYQQILKANADHVQDLEWRLEHTSTSGLGDVVVGATGSVQVLLDAVVRQVAQGCAGFATDGLREGIGHTFVGMMFNNNRLFAVDLKKQQGTTASEEDREYHSPDFDVWKTLNLELAWKSSGGVAAREVPLVDAATFSNEQRIKAWSFCDYVLRRDPTLLRDLDQLGATLRKARKPPIELEKQFDAAHDVKLAQLDKEWEDFWTEASSVLKAIQSSTPPLAAVSKGVEKWLEAFNQARQGQEATPAAWSTNLSTRCRDHALYLRDNKAERGPAKEHRQLPEFGGTHLGAMFAEMAIVEPEAKLGNARKMLQRWLDLPGYRDALVHDFLLSVGIYTEGDILVMNVVSGLGTPRSKRAGYLCYPRRNAQGIPTEVAVADLGPELQELLARHGQGERKVAGYPLTLHFGINVQGNRQSYKCTVTANGKQVAGALLMDGGKVRRTSAPGMVTFYPFEPLPHGDIEVLWTWDQDGAAQRLNGSFKTK